MVQTEYGKADDLSADSADAVTRHTARTDIACRNCGTPAPANYCPQCGQVTTLHPPTVGEFVHEFIDHIVALDGVLFQTLRTLLLQPGALTLAYLAGKKRKYMLPLRLYLTISFFVWIGISLYEEHRFVSLSHTEQMTNVRFIEISSSGHEYVSAGFQEGKFICIGLPELLCNRLRNRYQGGEAEMRSAFEKVPENLMKYLSYGMFAIMPLFAALMYAAYPRRKMVYGEHLVFSLHLHSFLLAALLLMALLPSPARAFLACAIFAYALLAIRRVYSGKWWQTILKTIGISAIYLFLMMAFVMLAAVAGLAF